MRARGTRWLGLVLLAQIFACLHSQPAHPSAQYHANTRPRLNSAADFEALCTPESGRLQSVKFVIADFQRTTRFVRFLDGNFYTFHDEWFWYQILNGIPVADQEGFSGAGFASPQDATAWARRQSSLPLDLRVTEERLYSDGFYASSVSDDRSFGLGAIVRIPATHDRAALWGFELEYTDVPTREHVETFYAALYAVLPDEIRRDLRWLTRSAAQADLGARMRAAQSPVQTIDYADLANAGEAEVYATGVRAGRLRLLDAGHSAIEQASERDVLVVPAPLDDLPPAAGLISLVPLTPLSHFNVLARQRGIPCVYVGGFQDDPYLRTLLKAQAPVLLDARSSGVWIAPMSESEYAALDTTLRFAPHQTPPPASTGMPYVRALGGLARDPGRASLQEVGGKMLGFVTLAKLAEEDRPSPVAAITVRAYAEHVQPLEPTLRRLLADDSFARWPRLRLLTLEGPKAFAHAFPSAADRTWAKGLAHGHGVVAEVVRQGGVQAMIRARAMRADTLQAIRAQLGASMTGISRAQALRFRSSSTIEDIEGFNAAGLYDSSTGYLDRTDKKGLEAAIKRTWASYWTYRAFEERRRSDLDSLLGRMAIVVHPRFDDDQELANAVVTFTLFPAESAQIARMDVNAQLGALSVTNPPVDKPDALPEVTRVALARGAAEPSIARIRPSTELADGARVFDDASLRATFSKLQPLARHWLALHNARIDRAERARMVTLDLELRRMAPEWPAGDTRTRSAPRWVVKQVRTLEPPPPIAGVVDLALPIPRDVLVRSVKITRRHCERDDLAADLIEAYTGSDFDPDLGYSHVPFVASIMLETNERTLMFTHLDFTTDPDRMHYVLAPEAAAQLGARVLDLGDTQCTEKVQVASQGELMRTIAQRAKPIGHLAGASAN